MHDHLIDSRTLIEHYFPVRAAVHDSRSQQWRLHSQSQHALVEAIHLGGVQGLVNSGYKWKNTGMNSNTLHENFFKGQGSTKPLKPSVSAPLRMLSEISVMAAKRTLEPAFFICIINSWWTSPRGTALILEEEEDEKKNTYGYAEVAQIPLRARKSFGADVLIDELEHACMRIQWRSSLASSEN